MRNRILIIGGLALTGLALIGIPTALLSADQGSNLIPVEVSCQEDEPCWDWRTMGNQERSVCIDNTNHIESADGTFRPGGRGCEARPLKIRCQDNLERVQATGLKLPIGWTFSCPEGRSIPNGITDHTTKLIRIGDSAGDTTETMLQYVIAHELCHAKLATAGEAPADACAAQYGFRKP